MTMRRHARGSRSMGGWMVVGLLLLGPAMHAHWSFERPLMVDQFDLAAQRGFGDRNNSWAQSMVWWRNNLYVGTARQSLCTSLYAVWQFVGLTVNPAFADTWFPYPPPISHLSCPADGADLALQAEIWRWRPRTDDWQRVFQSPLDLDNPGPGAGLPPPPGKKLPYETAIRGLTPHVERDGREALYAFGVNSTIIWDRTKLPPPRILRSTDGLTFSPIPQTPGTFLGDLPFNPDHSSFRSPVSYGGKLFVLAGPAFGQGSLIASANPARGDDAWFLAGAPNVLFYELTTFNGWLYLGTFDPDRGYGVLKTRAKGMPPYEFLTVVPPGAYLTERPSKSVVSMHEYHGRLYVGTATQTEVIRINPDDTWDLVIGPPREVPLPRGGSEWKYPISGLDAGFEQTLNDHAWQMEDFQGVLYIGTYNASIASKDDPVFGPLLEHNMGGHLYRTDNGWHYSPVTTDGFSDPSDLFGGRFDYGIRTMTTTPYGMFLGTANDFYGLAIFRAKARKKVAPEPPGPLEVEPTGGGSPLLSWKPTPGSQGYEIWRAEVHPILVRDDTNFEAWNGEFGNKIPDTYVGPYEQIGSTHKPVFVDTTVDPERRYVYYVRARLRHSKVTGPSNLVAVPLLAPPVTFGGLRHEVARIEARRRVRHPGKRLSQTRARLDAARDLAAGCRIDAAIKVLDPKVPFADAVQPEATDLEVLAAKLVRRLELAEQFPQDVSVDGLCTRPGWYPPHPRGPVKPSTRVPAKPTPSTRAQPNGGAGKR